MCIYLFFLQPFSFCLPTLDFIMGGGTNAENIGHFLRPDSFTLLSSVLVSFTFLSYFKFPHALSSFKYLGARVCAIIVGVCTYQIDAITQGVFTGRTLFQKPPILLRFKSAPEIPIIICRTSKRCI